MSYYKAAQPYSDSQIELQGFRNREQADYADAGRADTYSSQTPVMASSAAAPVKPLRGGAGRPRVKWIAAGVVTAAVIVAAVLGGVLGSRAADDDDNSGNSAGEDQQHIAATDASAPGEYITAIGSETVYPLDSDGNPVYPTASSVATASGAAPTVTSDSDLECSDDPFTPSNTDNDNFETRSGHPKLFAPEYKWDCLPDQINNDPYMAYWNETIFANASRYADMDPQAYVEDGGLTGSGVLDPAREIQLRIKHWGYAWRMTQDTKWSDRAWLELQTASGNNSDISFGQAPDRWNSAHFLDLAEFTLAFAYGYDWMYDAWTDEQRDAIMWSIINLGLNFGLQSYTDDQAQASYGWWQSTNGNWNCVCNGGLTLGALAIIEEDPTGTAQALLGHTIDNARGNCLQATQNDGTWSETSDYWYFGMTGTSQMVSGLISATGHDHGLLESNPALNETGEFHMYGTGFVEKFNWGDCGPNKYTATANSLMFIGNQLDVPTYTLYQREREDAPDPLSMFWYNPETRGDWWNGLNLDHSFDDQNDTWVSMRSSWSDSNALYAGMKSGRILGHQTHGNLDVGDFVFEAMGQRWAGELCQDQYLGPGYFSSEDQDSERWLYYRTRTEGQNTVVIDYANQDVDADPPLTNYGSTGDSQDSLAWTPDDESTAFWISDISSAYNSTDSFSRGMRLLNGRKQMLIQDEITGAGGDVQWRMHTNATISYSDNDRTAELSLGGETLNVMILSPENASFATLDPVRYDSDPPVPTDTDGVEVELPNPGVSVLSITLSNPGDANIQVLFNPQWEGMSSDDFVTPPSVSLDDWSLRSHDS